MQSFSKRFLKFNAATKLRNGATLSFATRPVSMKMAKKIMPFVGMTGASLYLMNTAKFGSLSSNSRFASAEEEYKLHEITGHEDLEEGGLMPLKVGEDDADKIVIAKYQGKLYALSNSCSHLGVPLAFGVLFDDKLICPAHNAAFSILDGFPEEAPAKNALQTFEVVEKDGKFFVKLPSDFKSTVVTHMATRDKSNNNKIVIVGGGPASLAAAETLRQADYTGEIVIISAEDKLSYDRSLLSKALINGDADKFIIRDEAFMNKYGIEFKTGSRVKKVDTEKNEIVLSDDTTVPYSKLLLATGGYPRKPIIPGIDLQGIHCLRGFTDQEAIKAEVGEGKKVVVVGASFIGYECAASIASTFKDKIDVTICDMISTPFELTLGKEVGGVMQKLAEENNVKFSLKKGVRKFIGKDGRVSGVELDDGTILGADIVILGTGIQPATQYIGEGIELEKDGSVKVDPYLRTSNENVYAAGDIANYPYWVTGDRIRVEHWNHASHQGEVAALNMIGEDVPYEAIPFFWTRSYNVTVQYTGHCSKYDDVFIDGNLDERKFVAYYINGDKVCGAAAMAAGPAIHVIKEAMKLKYMPDASKIKDGSVTINDLKEKVKSFEGVRCQKRACCQNKLAK
jgi:apoptosis-inducing factor 3